MDTATNPTQDRGITAAVTLAGTQVALAKALGVSNVSIHHWVVRGFVPKKRAAQIHNIYPSISVLDLIDPELRSILKD